MGTSSPFSVLPFPYLSPYTSSVNQLCKTKFSLPDKTSYGIPRRKAAHEEFSKLNCSGSPCNGSILKHECVI